MTACDLEKSFTFDKIFKLETINSDSQSLQNHQDGHLSQSLHFWEGGKGKGEDRRRGSGRLGHGRRELRRGGSQY